MHTKKHYWKKRKTQKVIEREWESGIVGEWESEKVNECESERVWECESDRVRESSNCNNLSMKAFDRFGRYFYLSEPKYSFNVLVVRTIQQLDEMSSGQPYAISWYFPFFWPKPVLSNPINLI